jgi:hypothetical protein
LLVFLGFGQQKQVYLKNQFPNLLDPILKTIVKNWLKMVGLSTNRKNILRLLNLALNLFFKLLSTNILSGILLFRPATHRGKHSKLQTDSDCGSNLLFT